MEWIKDDSDGRFAPVENAVCLIGDVIGYRVFPSFIVLPQAQGRIDALEEMREAGRKMASTPHPGQKAIITGICDPDLFGDD